MADSTYSPCDLLNIAEDTSCEEQIGGIGEEILFFKKSDLSAQPVFDATKPGHYTEASFAFATGKGFYSAPLKSDENEIASTSIGYRKCFKNTLTAVIDQSTDEVDTLMRALNNTIFGALVPDINNPGTYFVLYNPDKRLNFSYSGTTGKTSEDDTTSTLTIEAVQKFPKVRWSGTVTKAGASA